MPQCKLHYTQYWWMVLFLFCLCTWACFVTVIVCHLQKHQSYYINTINIQLCWHIGSLVILSWWFISYLTNCIPWKKENNKETRCYQRLEKNQRDSKRNESADLWPLQRCLYLLKSSILTPSMRSKSRIGVRTGSYQHHSNEVCRVRLRRERIRGYLASCSQ